MTSSKECIIRRVFFSFFVCPKQDATRDQIVSIFGLSEVAFRLAVQGFCDTSNCKQLCVCDRDGDGLKNGPAGMWFVWCSLPLDSHSLTGKCGASHYLYQSGNR